MNNLFTHIKRSLTGKQKESLRTLYRGALSFVPHSSNLSTLALKHGTDKRGHGYLEHYHRHFDALRMKPLNILEIGIGGYDDPKAGGASLRTWQDYFPNSMIYGLDIVDKTFHEDSRIRIFTGSQNDPEFLHAVAKKIDQIDIIIDDGSHVNEHVCQSFTTLFPLLNNGGIYVVEDLQTAYMPQYGGSSTELRSAETSMLMLKDLADGLNHAYIDGRTASYTDAHIESLHFYPKLAFIYKGANNATHNASG